MKYVYILFLAFVVLLLPACGSDHGAQKTFAAGELYYKDGATAEDADKLGQYLQAVGFFDEETPYSTQLVKRGNTYVFRFSVEDKAIQDESFARILRFMAMDISADVFDNTPVDIEMTDGEFIPLRSIPSPGSRTGSGKASIYRANEVDPATADKVTAYLTQIGFIGNKEITLSYARQGDDFIYEFVTDEGAENQPELVNANKTIAGLLSAEVLQNKPVTLHFLDEDYSIKTIYPFEEILTSYREFLADSAGKGVSRQ